MIEAGRITRGLQIRAEIDHVNQNLQVPLRLHTPSHESKRHKGLTFLHHERRDDRLERSLSRRDHIRTSGSQREQGTAVLENEAVLRYSQPGTKVVVDTIDKRHHVSRTVRRTNIDSAARMVRL